MKTTPIDPSNLESSLSEISDALQQELFFPSKYNIEIPEFDNIDFWFKPKVIRELAFIKKHILEIDNSAIRDFFLIPFSETVREVSNTRNSEFKL